jgi:hypothetical protein
MNMKVFNSFVLLFPLTFIFSRQNQEDFDKSILDQNLSDTASYRLHFTGVMEL